MRIRTATWDELIEEPVKRFSRTEDTHCWCARPGGCETKLTPGHPGRLCDICLAEHHPIHDVRAVEANLFGTA